MPLPLKKPSPPILHANFSNSSNANSAPVPTFLMNFVNSNGTTHLFVMPLQVTEYPTSAAERSSKMVVPLNTSFDSHGRPSAVNLTDVPALQIELVDLLTSHRMVSNSVPAKFSTNSVLSTPSRPTVPKNFSSHKIVNSPPPSSAGIFLTINARLPVVVAFSVLETATPARVNHSCAEAPDAATALTANTASNAIIITLYLPIILVLPFPSSEAQLSPVRGFVGSRTPHTSKIRNAQ
jgi:hypothetical protein